MAFVIVAEAEHLVMALGTAPDPLHLQCCKLCLPPHSPPCTPPSCAALPCAALPCAALPTHTQLASAIAEEERLAMALGIATDSPASSSLGSLMSLSSALPDILPNFNLSRALASSPDLCEALVASR